MDVTSLPLGFVEAAWLFFFLACSQVPVQRIDGILLFFVQLLAQI